MSSLTKDQEQYIEHEVKIRLHDAKFDSLEKAIDRLDNKVDVGLKHLDDKLDSSVKHLDSKFDSQFKWIIGMFVSSIIIPVVLHFVKAV